ncbi:MAG: hypothetical protein GY770_32335, partial [Aestuariibacter sp.]|nr:hypothetical protein [Aestuariibacter sp.]
ASLNLENGPLVRLVLFNLGDKSRLLWCIHHLAVHGVSWRILIEDLQTAYHQAVAGQPVSLPSKTSSFKVWAERLVEWQESESFASQAEYWRTLPMVTPLPIDNPTGRNRFVDSRHYTIRFTADTTQRLLTEMPTAFRTQINDLLLTSLMLALRDWTGDTHNLVDLESHGRTDVFADIDLSRTVGWFTSLHTIYLALPDTGNLGDCIQTIRKQLRQIPYNGVGYGVLRYLKGDVLPQGNILFNYLGQFDQSVQGSLISLSEESSGRSMSFKGEREHLIEINGQSFKGELSLTFSYSTEQYKSTTIQRLADNYQRQLQRLIEYAQTRYQPQPDLSTLLPLQSGGSCLPLFCLPGLGSKAGYFQQLAISLG